MKALSLILSGGMLVLAGCRTPQGTPEAAAAPVLAPASVTAERVMSERIHDRTDIRVSAQAGDGTVWGAGWSDGAGIFVWKESGWVKIEDAKKWAGQAVEMMASPGEPGVVYSLWTGAPNTGGDLSLFHVWRHEAGRPSRQVASLPNPVAKEDQHRNKPLLFVTSGGDVWISCAHQVWVRAGKDEAEPEILRIGDRTSERLQARGRPLRMREDDRGRVWGWSQADEYPSRPAGELSRPVYWSEGRVELAPALTGLPDRGMATFVSAMQAGGRMVWAIENAGLWDIDTRTLAATPRNSPPGAWRILDWRDLGGGIEVALVVERQRPKDRLIGRVWVREQDRWRDAGPTGDTQAQSPGGGGWQLRDREWQVWDDAILGVNFSAGVVSVDLRKADGVARELGWREHQSVRQPEAMYRLADGRLLIRGSGTMAVEPGALREGWSAEREHTVWTVPGNAVRHEDGRLWALAIMGRGAPAVKHWDGARWQEWPLPDTRPWWSEQALWVDASGRVAVFSEELDPAAWERDESVSGGWREWPSGKALIEARAAEPKRWGPMDAVAPGYLYAPVFSSDGRALIRHGAKFWYYRGGEWQAFDARAMGGTLERYGFDEAGVPWAESYDKKHRLDAGGAWVVAGSKVFRESLTSRGGGPWPEWLKSRFDYQASSTSNVDADGMWWIVVGGELWKAHAGKAARVFSEDEPSPFRAGRSLPFFSIATDSRGNRLFEGNSHVLMLAKPGPVLQGTVEATKAAADRRVVLKPDPGVEWFQWRLDGGAWRQGEGGEVLLVELTAGAHNVELRGYNRRLDAGPVLRVELPVVVNDADRVMELINELTSADYAGKQEATRRLALRGASAKSVVETTLANEIDESKRWWLRAALQAITDAETRAGAPDNSPVIP